MTERIADHTNFSVNTSKIQRSSNRRSAEISEDPAFELETAQKKPAKIEEKTGEKTDRLESLIGRLNVQRDLVKAKMALHSDHTHENILENIDHHIARIRERIEDRSSKSGSPAEVPAEDPAAESVAAVPDPT